MRSQIKLVLLTGVAWGVSSAAVLAAAPPPAPDATTVGEVVVTARRTTESLQKTPVSVSAFSQKQLDAVGARNTTDLQGLVPNMNIVQGRGSSDATNIYIRGVGQPDALQTFDPAVGVYIDDVYYARIRGTMFDLLNLQDLEVLRGPQGTLYGKNTIGGAMKLTTVKPGDSLQAGVDLTVGTYDTVDVKGYVSGPVTDTLSLGLSALSDSHSGYVKDPLNPGRTYNDQDTQAARAQLAWRPASDFRVDLSLDYTDENPHMTVGQATHSLASAFGTPLYTVSGNTPPKWDWKTSTSPNEPNKEPLQSMGASAVETWNINSAFTLKSITAFRHLKYDDYIDIDATPSNVGDVQVAVDQSQYSQELQLDYKSGPWSVVSGAFYMYEHITSNQDSYGSDYVEPFTFLRTISDNLHTTSVALYSNATYAVSDKFHITAGVRLTQETKKYFFTTTVFSDLGFIAGTYNTPFQSDPKTWGDVAPTISADYRITPNAMVYARAAEGFQSGGFNGRAEPGSGVDPYKPENIISYEVGAKTDWLGHRLRLNGDVFYNHFKDFQATVEATQLVGGINEAVDAVVNAGGLDISGVELEAVAAPTKALRIDAEIGYLDAHYTSFYDQRFPENSRAGQTPAFSPKWTIRLGPSYHWDLPFGVVTLSDQVRFRSSMALAIDNTPYGGFQRLPGMWQNGYWVDDAELVWTSLDHHYSLGVYAKNIGNVVYRTDAQNFYTVGQILTAYYGDPETVNVTLRYRY
jgi:iron complex outermembrane receptor protein